MVVPIILSGRSGTRLHPLLGIIHPEQYRKQLLDEMRLQKNLSHLQDFKHNDSIFIPPGHQHPLENPGRILLKLVDVQSPAYTGDHDIVKFDDIYRRNEPVPNGQA